MDEIKFYFREISQNFAKFLEMILPKFREISRNIFSISQNFVVLLVS